MTVGSGPARMVAGMRVTAETVLGVRSVILEEATRLRLSSENFKASHQDGSMPALGDDLVSPYAARDFTDVTRALLDKCRADTDRLNTLGDSLAAAARAYGITEQEIRQSFNSSTVAYTPSSAPDRR